jgi:hypothetical protein
MPAVISTRAAVVTLEAVDVDQFDVGRRCVVVLYLNDDACFDVEGAWVVLPSGNAVHFHGKYSP